MDPLPVAVVGTLALDTIATVAHLPGPDEAARVVERHEGPGGAGANVAVGLATLGHAPALLTGAGPDLRGSPYEARLRDLGVDLSGVAWSDEPTARAFLFTGPGGHQQIYYDPGASPAMARCRLPEGFAGVAHFAAGHLPAYPGLMEPVLATFDPGQEVFHRPLEEVAACLPHADVLLLNGHERERLEAGLDRDLAGLLDEGLQALVTTLGPRGARVETPGEVLEVEAADAEVRDPSGAGDAHRAGFVYGVAHRLGWRDAARLGSVVAAAVVEVPGTQAGFPSLQDARDRYRASWGEPPF